MKKAVLRITVLFAALFAFVFAGYVPEAQAQSISDTALDPAFENAVNAVELGHSKDTLTRRIYRRVYHRRYYPRRRVYRRYYPTVRYYTPAPVVVAPVVVTKRVETVQQQPKQVVKKGPRKSHIDIGLRGTMMLGSDFEHIYATEPNPVTGGIGFYLRVRPIDHLGLEFTSDVLFNEQDNTSLTRVPLSVNVLGYLFKESPFNLYAAGGFDVIFNTSLDRQMCQTYNRTDCDADNYVQFGGNLGGGIEMRVYRLHFLMDARYHLMQARPLPSEFKENGDKYVELNAETDKLEHDLQVSVGMGFYF